MHSVSHLMEQREHLMPIQHRRAPTHTRPRKLTQQHHKRQLIHALLALHPRALHSLELLRHLNPPGRPIQMLPIIVHPSRTPHSIMRRSTRLSPPREQVRIDIPNMAVVLINHLHLVHVRVPHLPGADVRGSESYAVEMFAKAGEGHEDSAERKWGERDWWGGGFGWAVEVAVPGLDYWEGAGGEAEVALFALAEVVESAAGVGAGVFREGVEEV